MKTMMKANLKKATAWLLTLVLLAGMIPMAAITASAAVFFHVASVTVDGTTTNYDSIESAFEAAADASGTSVTLTLLDSFTTDTFIAVDKGKFTIDLNGCSWVTSSAALLISGTADIKITDSATGGTIKAVEAGFQTIIIHDSASLEIAGGTIENTAGNSVVDTSDFGNPSSSRLTLSGGKVVAKGPTAISAHNASITVTGGTVESARETFYYLSGVIDLSGYKDLSELVIYIDYRVTLDMANFKLPDGYAFFEGDTAVAVLELDKAYTVKALAAPAPTYTVTVPTTAPVGGTLSTDLSEAKAGDTVTVTVTPEHGYKFYSLTVSGIEDSVGTNLSKVNETTYTFTMPANAVTVSAVFEELPVATLEDLEAAVAELKDLISGNGTQISDLSAKLAELSDTIARVDAENRLTEIEALLKDLTENVIPALSDKVTANENASKQNAEDIGDLNTAVGDLQTLVSDLQTSVDTLGQSYTDLASDTSDLSTALHALSTDLTGLEARVTDVETATKALEDAVKKLEDALSESATVEGVNAAIKLVEDRLAVLEALNAGNRITAAEQALTDLAEAVKKLNEESLPALDNKITGTAGDVKSLQDAVDSIRSALTGLSAEDVRLADLITALDGELATLSDSLDALEVRVTGAEDAIKSLDAALKNLETLRAEGDKANADALAKAEQDLKDAISLVEQKLGDTETLLKGMIADGDKTNADALANAVATLNSLIAAAEQAAEDADRALKADLEQQLADAEQTLNDAIALVQKNLDDAEKELTDLMNAGDKANADALANAITELKALIAAAEQAAEDANDALKADLEQQLADAEETLGDAIALVQKNLNEAKEELTERMNAGDKANADALTAAVEELNAAIELAKQIAADADAELKDDLLTAIAVAKKKAVEAANQAIEKAKEELKSEIAKGDKANEDALKDAVDQLQNAINAAEDAAKNAAEEADAALKAELENMIKSLQSALDEAKNALEDEISKGDKSSADALASEVEALRKEMEQAKKDAQVLPTVLAVIALVGDVALVVWIIIELKRRRTAG